MSAYPAMGVGFGPGTLGFPAADELLLFGQRAEEIGFDHFWVNDHLSWIHPLLDPVVLLSSIAARTSRIGLATGVYLLPLRSPAATARAFASLDYLSGGRAMLGVGIGGEFAEDFTAAGVPIKQRAGRTDATIRVLRQLWSGEPTRLHDKYFQFDNVQVLPRPANGRIPIIVGGRSEAALSRAAHMADGWMPYLMSPDRVTAGITRLRELAPERDLRVIAHVFAYFGPDIASAQEEATRYLSAQYHRDMTSTVRKCVPCGPVDAVVEQLAGYALDGVTDVVLRPLSEPGRLLASLEEDAAGVLTAWRKDGGHR